MKIYELGHNIEMENLARTPKLIGVIIQNYRKKNKLSQSQLGEAVNLWQETISKIENGNPATRIDNICDILSALELELVIRPRASAPAKNIEDIF